MEKRGHVLVVDREISCDENDEARLRTWGYFGMWEVRLVPMQKDTSKKNMVIEFWIGKEDVAIRMKAGEYKVLPRF